jgi:hypothetical protein
MRSQPHKTGRYLFASAEVELTQINAPFPAFASRRRHVTVFRQLLRQQSV